MDELVTATESDAPADGSESLERDRKRFARRQWARRWLSWRPLIAAVLVLALLALGVWLVWFSSVLAVKGVDVTGTDRLTAAEVRAAAAVDEGEPLATTDLDAIAGRVRALGPVKSVNVSRGWPDRVLIDVTERVPVAVIPVGSQFRAVDATGVVFTQMPKRPAKLPLLVVPSDVTADAMREGAGVVAALDEDLRARVDHIEVESIDQITLELRNGRTVLWGSTEQSADKADVLAALIEARPRARSYNVSVPGRPTAR